MSVRPAAPGELETVRQLWEELYGEFPARPHRRKHWSDVEDDMRRYLAEEVVLLAEEQGDAVGFAVAWPENERVGYVGLLYVRPELRRRGIGRALLAQAAQRLDRPFVTLSVDTDAEARSFYRRLGFREDALSLVIEAERLR